MKRLMGACCVLVLWLACVPPTQSPTTAPYGQQQTGGDPASGPQVEEIGDQSGDDQGGDGSSLTSPECSRAGGALQPGFCNVQCRDDHCPSGFSCDISGYCVAANIAHCMACPRP